MMRVSGARNIGESLFEKLANGMAKVKIQRG